MSRARGGAAPRAAGVTRAVRSGAAGLALTLLAASTAVPAVNAATVTRGPYLQCGTPTSVVVRWRTNVATSTAAAWGTGVGWSAAWFGSPTTTETEHAVLVSGLQPGTRYWYGIGTTDSALVAAPTCTFVTPPAAGTVQPVRAWILGDSGDPTPMQLAVRDAFLAYTGTRGADLVLMLGDNAYSSGTDSDYQAGLFDPYALPLRQWVLWPTRGNHDDLHPGGNSDYFDFFTLPAQAEAGGVQSGTEAYYSYDYANIHFVCLDSQGSSRAPNGAMLTWLRADLTATDQDWIIAYWHHPPYSKGSHNSDKESQLVEMRQNAVPILDSLGCDLVLCGHSHSYERSFLLRQHYGVSGTLADSMKVDAGDGRRGGNGPYHKPTPQQAPFEGAVYVVAGSSAHTGGGSLNHPVMVSSQSVGGSLVLDVNGGVLDLRFLDESGAVTDSFAILKGSGIVSVPGQSPPASGFAVLGVAPRPAAGPVDLTYRLPRPGPVRAAVYGADGRRIVVLAQGEQPAGEHRVRWDARDSSGRRVAAGVYFAVVEFGGERRATRVILTP